MTTVPTVGEVATRLGKTIGVIAEAYLAEVTDQATRCRVAIYNDALAEALCRRISRNLAMRNLPLGVVIDDVGSTRIGSTDPEVRRLEAPYLKVPVA